MSAIRTRRLHDLEGLFTMPEGHYDELNSQIDEWQKYLDNLPQGEDEENS